MTPCPNCGRDAATERVVMRMVEAFTICTFCGWRLDDVVTIELPA